MQELTKTEKRVLDFLEKQKYIQARTNYDIWSRGLNGNIKENEVRIALNGLVVKNMMSSRKKNKVLHYKLKEAKLDE